MATPHGGASPAPWHLSAAIATAAFLGNFHIWLYQHEPSPPLEANLIPLITWAPPRGLKKCTARSYCKETSHNDLQHAGAEG